MKASPLGEGGRDERGHPDPQLPGAEAGAARRRAPDRMLFEKVAAQYDEKGRRTLNPDRRAGRDHRGRRGAVAIGQENAFPGSSATAAIEFRPLGLPKLDAETLQSTRPQVFFGGDAAFGPKNIIWAVAHGHQAAVLHRPVCKGEDVRDRPPPHVTLTAKKMGIHEWVLMTTRSSLDLRYKVPHLPAERAAARHHRGGRARLRPARWPISRRSAA